MKNVIILQNSQAFTVDIQKIANKDNYRLFLLVNQESFCKLKDRKQDSLFEKIYIINDFSFLTLVKYIDDILLDYPHSKIDIVTNSEWCVNVCGKLRKHYLLNGIYNVIGERFTDKDTMKNHLKSFGIRLPKYFLFNREEYNKDKNRYIEKLIDTLGFPIFVKPTNDANCAHTAKLLDSISLQNWLTNNENDIPFEFDEFIEGKLYHCDAFIQNSEILYTAVSEYSYPVYEYLKGKPLGSITLSKDTTIHKKIESYNKHIIKCLNYQGSGITHLEVFLNTSDEIIFLEIAARAGGAWLPKIYKKHLNIDFFESHFLLQINDTFSLNIAGKGPYAACIWYPFYEGSICMLNKPLINSKFELKINAEIGKHYHPSSSLREKFAEIFLWNNDFDVLYKDFNYLKEFHIFS